MDAQTFLLQLLQKKPEILKRVVRPHRAFYDIGHAAMEELDEVHLTAHTPHRDRRPLARRYRLWMERPRIEQESGHPDWFLNEHIALAETIVGPDSHEKHVSQNYDSFVVEHLARSNAFMGGEPKYYPGFRNPEADIVEGWTYCPETRIYWLK